MRFLAEGPRNVTEIAGMLAIPAVNVSHHLTVLKIAKLIRGNKAGRFVHYALCPGVLDNAVDAGISEQALNLGCCTLALPLGEVKTKC